MFNKIFCGQRKFPNLLIDLALKKDIVEFKDIKWGESFVLGNGHIDLIEDHEIDIAIDVNALDLEILSPFLNIAQSHFILGILDGEFEIYGESIHPYIKGVVDVKKGAFGEVKFKNAHMVFVADKRGLTIGQAKVIRQKDTLIFKGNIDFSKENPYENVSVQSIGQMTEWDGWKMGQDKLSGELKMEKNIDEQWTIAFKNLMDYNDPQADTFNSSVELEYGVSEKDKVIMSIAEEDNFVGYKKKYVF